MTVKIFVGDCRTILRAMPAESVHCCVTSPPYYGLRDYQIEPSVWGGDPTCAHEWGDAIRKPGGAGLQGKNSVRAGRANIHDQEAVRGGGNFCNCGAWRGSFGLEPDYRMYLEHAVEIFREVWRVLRSDGTLWLNLGDSYATGAGGVGDHPGGGAQGAAWAGRAGGGPRNGSAAGKHEYTGIGPMTQPGLKPKDLMGIPWRVAFALQDDGWWLRQDVIWAKPNPMPESVTDRCTKSHEYLFMLTKSERYYFDQDAILEPISVGTHLRVSQATLAEQTGSDKVPGKSNGPMKAVLRGGKTAESGLGIKNNESMDAALVAPGRRSGNKERKPASARGVPIDTGGRTSGAVAGSVPWEGFERNKRSVWTVTTVPFGGEFCRACQSYYEGDGLRDLRVETIDHGDRKEKRRHCRCGSWDKWLSHFATFPPTLIEPCIEASTSEYGCCVTCGSPWRRETKVSYDTQGRTTNGPRSLERRHEKPGFETRAVKISETTGWEATCECAIQTTNGRLARGVVLDLFGGAGTTGMASDRLRRDAVLIEINPEYAEMARQRLALDAGPMFGDIKIIAPVHEAAE